MAIEPAGDGVVTVPKRTSGFVALTGVPVLNTAVNC